MDGAGTGPDAVVVAIQSEELPVCGAGIVEYSTMDKVSNLKDMDDVALLPTTIAEEEPINHESQVFVRAWSRTVILNVNLRRDSVEEVKRLVEEREGIPITEQHLSFGGKPLQDGTFLRDYDTLGDKSRISVSLRIRGGNRIGHMTLKDLAEEVTREQRPMTLPARIPGKQQAPAVTVLVLAELGERILHGVLTCVLSAHRVGLSYAGAFGMDDLMVYVHMGPTELVVSGVYVQSGIVPSAPLDDERQKKDYKALSKVIQKLFPQQIPLHVGSICRLLDSPVDMTSQRRDNPSDLVMRRTHLLQAHASIIGSPIAVATMFLNLKRFYDQLGTNKFIFETAMKTVQKNYRPHVEVNIQPLFEKVYRRGNLGSLPTFQYAGDRTGMELFNFARNWFAHVPEERWNGGMENFTGLPHLDYIFTYHFPNLIPEILFQLYKSFDDYKVLTKALVPLA